jgi:predicted DNA-binding transcriptional regulator YafY
MADKMARGDQLSRQWRIIQSLLASRKGKSASDLSEDLDCHSRTVYRDLEALQMAGFPLYTEKEEGRTLWALLDEGMHQMPIPLNLTELMALYFSRNMLKILDGTGIYDSLVSLFDKVKATLPSDYIDYLEKVEYGLEVGVKAHKPYRRFQQTLSQVHEAVQRQCRIDMCYFTMSRNDSTRRTVDPYKVWFYDETFYLIGYCHLRQDIRLFAVDRIESITLLETEFNIPEGFDAEEFMQSSFGVFRGEPVNVQIRFAPESVGYIKEKIWHPTQVLTPEPDGSIIFSAVVAGIEEIKIWTLKWGAAAEVLKPETLRRQLAEEAKAMMEKYATNENR